MAGQSELRSDILRLCLPFIQDRDDVNQAAIEAFAACMGAAAVCAGVLNPEAREELVIQAQGFLLERANAHAKDIRSGKLDRDIAPN